MNQTNRTVRRIKFTWNKITGINNAIRSGKCVYECVWMEMSRLYHIFIILVVHLEMHETGADGLGS